MELRNIGWNVITFTLVFTLICTALEAFGLYEQRKKIWAEKSGASVSVLWFSFLLGLYAAVVVYGQSIDSVAMRIDGAILALSTMPVLIGLAKFKGFTTTEKIAAALFAAGIAAMIALPYKAEFFLAYSIGNIVVGLKQPWEIWKNKYRGVLDRSLLFVFLFVTVCWSVYAFVFGDLVLEIVFPSLTAVVVLTLIMWYRYPPPQMQNATP